MNYRPYFGSRPFRCAFRGQDRPDHRPDKEVPRCREDSPDAVCEK